MFGLFPVFSSIFCHKTCEFSFIFCPLGGKGAWHLFTISSQVFENIFVEGGNGFFKHYPFGFKVVFILFQFFLQWKGVILV